MTPQNHLEILVRVQDLAEAQAIQDFLRIQKAKPLQYELVSERRFSFRGSQSRSYSFFDYLPPGEGQKLMALKLRKQKTSVEQLDRRVLDLMTALKKRADKLELRAVTHMTKKLNQATDVAEISRRLGAVTLGGRFQWADLYLNGLGLDSGWATDKSGVRNNGDFVELRVLFVGAEPHIEARIQYTDRPLAKSPTSLTIIFDVGANTKAA